MKPVWKYICIGLVAILFAAGFTLSYIEGQKMKRKVVCSGIEICIKDSMQNRFIDGKIISRCIDKEYGKYLGISPDSVNLTKMENLICSRTAVRNCEAFISRDGCLHIEITQKKPFVRFQNAGNGYYSDIEGNTFPLQGTYSSYVPVIEGRIPAGNDTLQIRQLVSFVRKLEEDKDWKGKIVQINVDENGDLSLYPREGKEKFLFGKPHDVEAKLEKMKLYYTTIVPNKGAYKIVDLKYKDQIVCK